MVADPLRTRLCDMLGIQFPIVAFSHCKDVVAEITNAGGLGVLGEVARTPDEIAKDIAWLRQRVGDRPFGVDLLIPESVPAGGTIEELEKQIPAEHRQFMRSLRDKYGVADRPTSQSHESLQTQEYARKQLDVVLSCRVPVFASGLGNPAFVLEAAHAQGSKVFGLVGKTRQARREIEAGVDVVVAQGADAGGHTGPIGTFSLVPQVVDVAGDTPVLAAGGVGTGRHLAAALCLGASGVWTGSIWVASQESDADMVVKEKMLAATEDDTIVSKCYTGKTARQLKTAWTLAWEEPDAPKFLPMPLQGILVREFVQQAEEQQVVPLMGTPVGQVVGIIHQIKPARQILLDMVAEALDVFDRVAVPAGR